MNTLVEQFYNVACMNRFDVHVLMDYSPDNILGFRCKRCDEFHVVSRAFFSRIRLKLRSESRAKWFAFSKEVQELLPGEVFKEEIIHYYGDDILSQVQEVQAQVVEEFKENLCADKYEKSSNGRSFEVYCPLHGYHLISRSEWNEVKKQFELVNRSKKLYTKNQVHVFIRQAVNQYLLESAKVLQNSFTLTSHVPSEGIQLVKSSRFRPNLVEKLNMPEEMTHAEVLALYTVPSAFVPREYMIEFGACGRKRRYVTKQNTIEAMRDLKVAAEYQPYSCGFCNGWHYGRKSAKKVTEASRYSTGMFWYKRHPDKANEFFMRIMGM